MAHVRISATVATCALALGTLCAVIVVFSQVSQRPDHAEYDHHATTHHRNAPALLPVASVRAPERAWAEPNSGRQDGGAPSCSARLQPNREFTCAENGHADCSRSALPVNMTALCPPEKLQDAYHIEAEGVCTQVCLPPALRKVAANHGVRYGMTCVGGTPLNRCTRFYLAGSRAGVRYFTFFCLEPCSASAQVCNGSTSEYNGLGHRGPARPRWAGDWWPGVPEDALETDELFCAARRAAVQPAAGAAAAPAGNGAPRGGPRLLESAPPALVREVHAVVPATAPLASAPAAHAAATVAAVKPAVADAGSLPPAAVFALAGPMRSSRQQRGRHHRSHEHRRRRLDHRV